jgi:hypothetical protein
MMILIYCKTELQRISTIPEGETGTNDMWFFGLKRINKGV